MTTTNNLREILDRKQWEMCNTVPFTSGNGVCFAQSTLFDKYVFAMTSATTAYLYDPKEDAWVTLPTTTAITGTYGAGSCTTYHPNGPTGTATAGTTTTLTTNLTLNTSLAGYTIRITGGPGGGDERTILSNTLGANSVITVSSAFSTTITTSSTYLLITGRFYAYVGGTGGPGMRYFDMATNTWSAALTMTNATSAGTDAAITTTPSYGVSFATGTATSATSTTLVNSAKTWTTNQWTSFQVRITAGTGAGQVRTISSNTATTLTVGSAWTVTPDSTSQYSIEGNDDYIYLAGNLAVTLYRYSIGANTWTVISPAVARSSSPGAGLSLNWVQNATASNWTNESAILNGRRIYSLRGNGSSSIDYYDIPSNSWGSVSAPPYSSETFTTGSANVLASNAIIYFQKDTSGRMFAYDPAANKFLPWSVLTYTQSTAVVGNRAFSIDYTDGATKLIWVYYLISTGNLMFRQLVI